MARVVVIGGGVSGLACGYGLRNRLPEHDVLVLEASDHVGGAIQTVRKDGWVCEGGPNAFLNRHPDALQMALDLGLDDELVTAREQVRRRFVQIDGRLRRFPDSFPGFMNSELLSFLGRTRAMMEPLVPHTSGREDESIMDFAKRRLGRQAAERMLDPVVAGIYAGDASRLSLKAAFPNLAMAEEKGISLLRLLVTSREESDSNTQASPAGVGRRRLVSFRDGMATLTEALADALGDSLWRNTAVRELHRRENGWRLVIKDNKAMDADAVVVAIPPGPAQTMLSPLDPILDNLYGAVPTAPVVVVGLGFRESQVHHPMNGFGYLVPSGEAESILGVMWGTSMFPGIRSPSGRTLLRVFMGGVRDRDVCGLSDDDLVLRARQHLARVMDVSALPVFQHCFRHWVGIPQYEVGHTRRLDQADAALLNFPGLFLAGHAAHGIGVSSCIARANRQADGVADYVRALRSPAVAQDPERPALNPG